VTAKPAENSPVGLGKIRNDRRCNDHDNTPTLSQSIEERRKVVERLPCSVRTSENAGSTADTCVMIDTQCFLISNVTKLDRASSYARMAIDAFVLVNVNDRRKRFHKGNLFYWDEIRLRTNKRN